MAPGSQPTKPIPQSTAYHRRRGRPARKQTDEDKLYITPKEQQILSADISRILDTGSAVKSEEVRNLAFKIKCLRLEALGQHESIQRIEPPGKNWHDGFFKRHKQELRVEKIKGLGWQRQSLLLGDNVPDFAASHSDIEQLCSECAGIQSKLKNLLTRARPNGSQPVHIFKGLLGGDDGSSCKLCRFVLACSKSWIWPTAIKYSLNVHHMENVLGPTLVERKVLLSLAIEDAHNKGKYRGWIVPKPLDDASGVSHPTWSSLTNTVNFEVVQSWLNFCDCNHSDSCGMDSYDNIPFFRLIDCNSRLIVDAPPESKFAALSYCWGPPESSPQHELNELPPKDRLKKLPNIVPSVIEDALDAARRLGITYLWVDRYCNEQHKNSPVKAIQLQNMHKVYRSAYVTIVAGYGDRPELGLPGMPSIARKPQNSVFTHGHQLIAIPDVVQEIQNSTWSTRGWTLQENLLSRRRLVFTETQTYFQCWHMHCCEAIPTCLVRAHKKDLSRFKDSNQIFRAFPQKGIGKTGAEIEMRIREYIGRRLTDESDALNAFLGILQAFQELEYPVNHFWGLPMSRFSWMKGFVQQSSKSAEVDELYTSFLSSLAWSNDLYDHGNVHILARRREFPSWTWAGWESLRTFSRKPIAKNPMYPSVSFQRRQGQYVDLENYEQALSCSNNLSLFQPCIFLNGWVTDIWFSEKCSGREEDPCLEVQFPIPTHRVSMIMDAQTSKEIRQNLASKSFQAILLGSGSYERSTAVSSYGWSDVHAMIVYHLPDATCVRLGTVTWSRLGWPSVDEKQGVIRLKELFEARRVVPHCQCGCQKSVDTSFDRYLEDDRRVLEFKKRTIQIY
jgi:hypothetical protein